MPLPELNSAPVRRSGCPGFSLIELLTVIALIGILAAVLLPAFSYIREAGYNSRCETNLKNLAVGVINFANDQGGWMPYSRPGEWYDIWSSRWNERTGWVNWIQRDGTVRDEWQQGRGRHFQRTPWTDADSQRRLFEQPAGSGRPYVRWWGDEARQSIREGSLWPYVRRDLSTYLCPRFRRRDTYDTLDGSDRSNAMVADPARSYVMNDWFRGERNIRWIEANSPYRYNERSGDRFKVEPSRLLLFADMQPNRDADGVRVCDQWCTSNTHAAWTGDLQPGTGLTARPTQSIGIIHRGRAQVIFVDGHVESFAISDFRPHPSAPAGAPTWGELVYQLCRGELL